MWGSVAGAWADHAEEVERRSEVVNRAMIDAVRPAPGDSVLELACGAGGLGLAIADMVAPGGRVLLTDVAPEMVEIASVRASRRDEHASVLVTARVIDLERIDLPDESFDIVVCREGLMFALDPLVRCVRSPGSCVRAAESPSPCGARVIAIPGSESSRTRSRSTPGCPYRHRVSLVPSRSEPMGCSSTR